MEEAVCIVCGEDADTHCELCEAGLCSEHATISIYSNVDVCADSDACDARRADHEDDEDEELDEED